MKSIIYYTKDSSSNSLFNLYNKFIKDNNIILNNNIAIKLHSGEEGNQNFIKPEFLKELINYINGTVVECNTAYNGSRDTYDKHIKLLEKHNWTKYFNVDILDSESSSKLDIKEGIRIKENYIGSKLLNYNYLIVLSHFKGHPMGGFGGSLKQLSIGCASSLGKAYIHSAGKTKDVSVLWNNIAPQNEFLESMADAAYSVDKLFKGRVLYINILKNISVDCDCCSIAEDPCIPDLGICMSTDPVALDKFSIDTIYNSNFEGVEHFKERVESRNGRYILECSEKLGTGNLDYKVINID